MYLCLCVFMCVIVGVCGSVLVYVCMFMCVFVCVCETASPSPLWFGFKSHERCCHLLTEGGTDSVIQGPCSMLFSQE